LTLHVKQFSVLKSFSFRSLFSLLYFIRIDVGLWRWHDEEVSIFYKDLDRLIPQVHPVEREGEFAEMSYAMGKRGKVNLRGKRLIEP